MMFAWSLTPIRLHNANRGRMLADIDLILGCLGMSFRDEGTQSPTNVRIVGRRIRFKCNISLTYLRILTCSLLP